MTLSAKFVLDRCVIMSKTTYARIWEGAGELNIKLFGAIS